MFKKVKNCCNEEFINFEQVKSRCQTIKEYTNQKALVVKVHLNSKGHYQYYYMDCNIEPCKCYLLDINSKVLHPDLALEDKLSSSLKSLIKSNEKNKSKSLGM